MQTIMPPINTEDGLFHEGNPSQGTQGTIVTGLFLNNVQGATRDTQKELTAILTAAGMLPDGTKNNQVLEAIKKVFNTTIEGKYLPIIGGVLSGNVYAPGVIGRDSGLSVQSETNTGIRFSNALGTIHKASLYTEPDSDGHRVVIHAGANASFGGKYYVFQSDGTFINPGAIKATTEIIWSNDTCRAHADGNISGAVWGGFLSNYINDKQDSARQAAQDWAYANLVSRIQRGAQGSFTMDGGQVEAPAGCVLTGGNGNEGNQVGIALYRPLQILRGGIWMTIEG
ncbi:hypothetical protein [Serratia fonticola]